MKIQTLVNAPLLINDDFLTKSNPSIPDREQMIINEIGEGPLFDLNSIRQKLTTIVNWHAGKIILPETDGKVAILLHNELTLTRRLASINDFWYYLTIGIFPEYVASRFYDSQLGKTPKERYLGSWTRNAFGRLWWWAELTYQASEKPYEWTEKAAQNQEFMLHITDDLFGGDFRLVRALAEWAFAGDGHRLKKEIFRPMITRLNANLITQTVDYSPESAAQLIQRISKEIEP
jgi:hypothetical protein